MKLKQSAVLILIVPHEQQLSIVLTKRTAELREHASQICFPGGRVEINETYRQAAIREFTEEVGSLSHVQILGELSTQLTSTHYQVHPIIAYSNALPKQIESSSEVDRLIFLPLSLALNKDNFEVNTHPECKIIRHQYCLYYANYFIWGITATILKELAENSTIVQPLIQQLENET